MSARPPLPPSGFAVEATPIGPQSLVPGVTPISPADRLRWRATQPLEPTKPPPACDHGLFDQAARHQLALFTQVNERPFSSFHQTSPPHRVATATTPPALPSIH